MPAIITHRLFGEAILELLGNDVFSAKDERAAFLLGNQGPDPLLYSRFVPNHAVIKTLGGMMHTRHVTESLDAMRAYACTLPQVERAIADAYLCGFICHFSLDSHAHPFVYSQQYPLCTGELEGADDFVHGQIESDLDGAMLHRITGKTIRDYDVRRILDGSSYMLEIVDGLYCRISSDPYDLPIARNEFLRAVHEMRRTVALLYSPTGIKRQVLGRLERLFREHSLAQVMSHRNDTGDTCDFDNANREAWINPFTHERNTTSFENIFLETQSIALDAMRIHEAGLPSIDITTGLNFLGDQAEDTH